MTFTTIRGRKAIVVVGALSLLLLAILSSMRVITGLERIKTVTDTVHILETRYALLLQEGSLPDITSLRGTVSHMQSQLRDARSQLTPFVQIASFLGWMPGLGPELRSSRDILDLGDDLAQASQDILTAVEITTSQNSLSGEPILEGNRFNENLLRNLSEGEPFFSDALFHLERASATLERLNGRDLPDSIRDVLVSAQAIHGDLETVARTGLAASQLWEGLLGYDKPQSYLLVAQNSDELRASGGFIPGGWVITLDRGEIVQLQFWDTEAVDDLKANPLLPPEGLLQSLWAGAWLFRDAGWYPDFPTSARAMEQIFELGQSISVDGTIALDQWAVQAMLDSIGPVTLPTGEMLDAESYMDLLEAKTDVLGHEFMDTVLQTLLEKLGNQGSEQTLGTLVETLNRSLKEKHMLVYFHDTALQEAAQKNGWSGALEDSAGDYLMVVDSNVGFSKVNRNIAQSISYTVDLTTRDKAQARLDILYTNQSTESFQDCRIQTGTRYGLNYYQQKNTCYWDYLRVYVPGGTALDSASPFPMPEGALYRTIGYNDVEDTARSYAESDKTVFGGLFNLEAGESRNVAFAYALPAPVMQDKGKGTLVYNLFLQKQPGTGSIPVEVTLRLPSGYCVRRSTPGITSVVAGDVHLRVDLSSDQELEVVLERRSVCKPLATPYSLSGNDLPKGITRTALGSVVIEPPTGGSAVTRVQVSPLQATLVPGQRMLFTSVALDTNGKPVQNVQFNWQVTSPAVGTVTPYGLFTAGTDYGRYPETLEVSATSPKGTAAASATVEIVTQSEAEARTLDSVIIYPPAITVGPSQTVGLGALGWDKRGRFVQNLSFEWRMADPTAGSINEFGVFTASAKPGSHPDAIEVSVTQNTAQGALERLAHASVTVSDSAKRGVLSQVVVIPRSIRLNPGQRYVLSARAFDASGQPVRDASVQWEVVQEGAGSIDEAGYFVAGQESGLYTNAIQAVATQQTREGTGQASAAISVTVESPKVIGDLTRIQLVPGEATLKQGQRFVFSALGLDADGNTVQTTGEWDVPEASVGSISPTGVFQVGSKSGRYRDAVKIRMTQEKNGQVIVVEEYATVNVLGTLDEVRVARSITTLEAGQSAWFFAVGYDSNGLEIPYLQLRWSMEDPKAGSITPSGFFTAGSEPGSYESAIKVTAVEMTTR